MSSRAMPGCATCAHYRRFEALAPKGDLFACAGCGRKFRRCSSSSAADRVLDVLLFLAKLEHETLGAADGDDDPETSP